MRTKPISKTFPDSTVSGRSGGFVFQCIDAHTCGNPVRLVANGGPALDGNNMSEKRQHLASARPCRSAKRLNCLDLEHPIT